MARPLAATWGALQGGDAEVDEAHATVTLHQNVAWLEAAVDDACAVGGFQHARHRRADLGHSHRRQRPLG